MPASYVDIAIYVLLFTAYFMVIEVVFFSVARQISGREAVNRRLGGGGAALHRGDGTEFVDQWEQQRGTFLDTDTKWGPQTLVRLSQQAGVRWRLWNLIVIPLLPAVVAGAGVYLTTRSIAAAVVLAAVAATMGPLLYLLVMRTRRIRKFESQLPDALDTIVRSIRAGHPLPSSIQMVVREYSDPIGKEFGQAADELTFGMDMETAMRNMNNRLRQHDLALVVSAISIQSKSGGNLTEILGNLAAVIRDRTRMRMKVRALSSEGRLSAIVLSSLPIALFFILSVTAPAFYGDIWQYGVVYPIFIAAGIWMAIGNLVMWRLVSFEI
ncbi:MAG: type II secretion system F family protein [Hyphomicrobiaceae bacterium]